MPRPLVVSLDQNHWFELSSSAEPEIVQIREDLVELSRAGDAVFPLSPVHYFETWHRREWRSRHRLAAVMAEVSSYVTWAPLEKLRRHEIAAAFYRRVGLQPTPVDAIGWGVRHAFDHPLGRLRLFDEGEAPLGPGHAPSSGMQAALQRLPPEAFEWFSLAGPDVDFDQLPGLDQSPSHRLGNEFVAGQADLIRHLDEHAPPGRRDDAIRIEFMNSAWGDFMLAAASIDLNPRLAFGEPPHGLDWLIDDVPTLATWCELEIRLLRNREYQWKQHDRNDLAGLAVAASYSDVLLTERHWLPHLTATTVARRRSIQSGRRLTDLLPLIERASPRRSAPYQRWA